MAMGMALHRFYIVKRQSPHVKRGDQDAQYPALVLILLLLHGCIQDDWKRQAPLNTPQEDPYHHPVAISASCAIYGHVPHIQFIVTL